MEEVRDFKAMRAEFEKTNNKDNSEILVFKGLDEGYTVYNCSVPIEVNGETYMFGRVEAKAIWANSVTFLFKKNKKGEYERDTGFYSYGLEDPFWERINGEIVLGGNIVFRNGRPGTETFRTMFFRSKNDIHHWYQFATGPYMMKDIRLVQLPEGKIGVFSRPRSEEIRKKFGSESMVGFGIINSLEELTSEVIENTPYIPNLFSKDEWGGVNQARYLGGDYIGLIGHQCYNLELKNPDGTPVPAYVSTAYVFNMKTHLIEDRKIIASRWSFIDSDYKTFGQHDTSFTSGIIDRPDGKVDLYAGLGDCFEGKKIIENPFIKYMKK